MAKVIITKNRAQAILLNEVLATRTGKYHKRLMPLAELRRRLKGQGISRAQVDDALLELAGVHAIVLEYHDNPAAVSEKERAEYLKHKGNYYFAVSLRD